MGLGPMYKVCSQACIGSTEDALTVAILVHLVHSVLPKYVPSHTQRISTTYPTHTHTKTTATTPRKTPREPCQCMSVHVSASLQSISGICTYKCRASRASIMAGMAVRVGTYQHANFPTMW